MSNERKGRPPNLYTDNKLDSSRAREILRENNIVFNEWVSGQTYNPEPGMVHPVLQSGEGDFTGLSGVEMYIDLMNSEPDK